MTRRATLGRRFCVWNSCRRSLEITWGQSAKICGKNLFSGLGECNTDGAEDNAHDLHLETVPPSRAEAGRHADGPV